MVLLLVREQLLLLLLRVVVQLLLRRRARARGPGLHQRPNLLLQLPHHRFQRSNVVALPLQMALHSQTAKTNKQK